MSDALHTGQQRAGRHENAVHEIVGFDARQAQRAGADRGLAKPFAVRPQSRAGALVGAPGPRGG